MDEIDTITDAHCCVRLGGRAGVSYVPCVLVGNYRHFNPGRVVLRTKLVCVSCALCNLCESTLEQDTHCVLSVGLFRDANAIG